MASPWPGGLSLCRDLCASIGYSMFESYLKQQRPTYIYRCVLRLSLGCIHVMISEACMCVLKEYVFNSIRSSFPGVRETRGIEVSIFRCRYSSELCLPWSYLPNCLYPMELIEVTFVLCQVRRLKLSILRQIHPCRPTSPAGPRGAC